MRSLFAALIIAGVPAFALAQTHSAPAKAHATATKKKAAHGKSHLAPSAQKAVEESTPIDDEGIKLSDEQLEIAKHVYVGEMKCELGASVKVVPLKHPGFFMVTTQRFRFFMHPVESRTGAVRLEDTRRGAMWLQLGNKSMLMSQKLGQRLADECQGPEQVSYAQFLKTHPQPSPLDGLGTNGHHHGDEAHGHPMQRDAAAAKPAAPAAEPAAQPAPQAEPQAEPQPAPAPAAAAPGQS